MDEIFTILAGVLHIGNIEFSGEDKVSIKDMNQVKLVCDILKLSEKNLVTSLTYLTFRIDLLVSCSSSLLRFFWFLKSCAALVESLSLSRNAKLLNDFFHRQRLFGGGGRKSAYHIPLTYAQAIENRDAMAKEIYSKLFNYLVARLNKSLGGYSSESSLFIGMSSVFHFNFSMKIFTDSLEWRS